MRSRAVLIAFATLAFGCSGSDGSEAAAATDAEPAVEAAVEDGVQVVQVTVQGNKYLFHPASVKAEQTVRLVFDPSGLSGCSRTVTLTDYDITKTIEDGDATIEFTPSGAGPITVACSMNMYTGTLMAE